MSGLAVRVSLIKRRTALASTASSYDVKTGVFHAGKIIFFHRRVAEDAEKTIAFNLNPLHWLLADYKHGF